MSLLPLLLAVLCALLFSAVVAEPVHLKFSWQSEVEPEARAFTYFAAVRIHERTG